MLAVQLRIKTRWFHATVSFTLPRWKDSEQNGLPVRILLRGAEDGLVTVSVDGSSFQRWAGYDQVGAQDIHSTELGYQPAAAEKCLDVLTPSADQRARVRIGLRQNLTAAEPRPAPAERRSAALSNLSDEQRFHCRDRCTPTPIPLDDGMSQAFRVQLSAQRTPNQLNLS